MSDVHDALGFVSIDEENWKRMNVLFKDEDITFFVNECVHNALDDFIVAIGCVSEAKLDEYLNKLKEDE